MRWRKPQVIQQPQLSARQDSLLHVPRSVQNGDAPVHLPSAGCSEHAATECAPIDSGSFRTTLEKTSGGQANPWLVGMYECVYVCVASSTYVCLFHPLFYIVFHHYHLFYWRRALIATFASESPINCLFLLSKQGSMNSLDLLIKFGFRSMISMDLSTK